MAVLTPVTDPDDPRLADYVDLRDVRLRRRLEAEHGLFMAEGEKVIRRAAAAGYASRSFLLTERWLGSLSDVLDAAAGVPCYVAPPDVVEKVTGYHVHRGALAAMHRRPLPSVAEVLAEATRVRVLEDLVEHANVGTLSPVSLQTSRIAVFEDMVDPTNLGAAFRSAAALGIDAVLVTPRCVDPLYRRAVKASMGTVFQLPWTRIAPWPRGIDILHEHGYVTAALTLNQDAIRLDELAARQDQRLALIFGTEGDGLSPRTVARANLKVRIPMRAGVDSLNVAAAAAVAFYAISTGRR